MDKKTVLIIDDSPISLKHAQSILKDSYATACTKSAEKALAYLADHIPDLILLDVKMPEMSGVELFGLIRREERLCSVPIVFLTGDEDGATDGIDCSGVIMKPAEPEQLLCAVREIIGE